MCSRGERITESACVIDESGMLRRLETMSLLKEQIFSLTSLCIGFLGLNQMQQL